MRLPTLRTVVAHSAAVVLMLASTVDVKADSIKADNTTPLNDPASWMNSTVPGATDAAIWDPTVIAANTVPIGGSLTWGQIQIGNPGGNVVIMDSTAAATLTLNGLNGVGVSLGTTDNLTLGATGANTADSLGVILGASQTWSVPTGRTLTLNGKRGPIFGSNVLTISGGGTFLYNPSTQFSGGNVATSDAGAGVVVNGSTFNTNIVAGGGSASYTNWLGANTALTMAGSTMNMQEGANTGTHKQTWTTLTLSPGASSFTMSARQSNSGIVSFFSTVVRNAGAVANFSNANITNNAGNNAQLYGLAGLETVGYATFGGNDFLKKNGATGAATVGAPTYVNDVWAAGNNTTVTVNSNFSAGPVLTTDTLRFNAAGAFTVTLPTGVNVISTGGILAGSATTTNNSTITGGSITSGNSGLTGGTGADLIVFSNSGSSGAVVINSNIVDNGATAVGLTKAGTGDLRLGGTNTFTGPSYINAGTVTLTNSQAWNGNSALNFGSNGTIASSGTFSLNGNSVTANGLTTTMAGVNSFVQNAGSAAGTLTVNVASGTNDYGGTVRDGAGVGAFSLTKTGAGSLVLSGSTLSYTGNTTVNGGSLVLKAAVPASSKFTVTTPAVLDVTALGSSGLALSTGKSLTGNGTVTGAVTVNGGTVIPGAGGAGVLTVTSLTSAAASNFTFGLASGNPTNNLISAIGSGNSLTLGGGGFTVFDAGTTNEVLNAGTFDLFQYAGTAPSLASLSAANIANPVPGLSYSWGLGSSGPNNYVQLTITGTAQLASWINTAGGTWSNAANWNGGLVPQNAGDSGRFSTPLAANVAVTLDSNKSVGSLRFDSGSTTSSTSAYSVIPGGGTLTFNNGATAAKLTNTYGNNSIAVPVAIGATTPSLDVSSVDANSTLTLSGGIAATTASLNVSGPGALALGGTNAYSGGTNVNNLGTLRFATGSLPATGAIVLNSGTLKWGTAANPANTDDISNRTITFGSGGATFDTNGNNVTIANPIGNSGTGSFSKTGAGTLALNAINTYSGQTTLRGGLTSIASDESFGSGTAGSIQVTASAINSPTVTLTSATLPSGFAVGATFLGQTVTNIAGTTVTLSGNANTAIAGDTPVTWGSLPTLNLNGGGLLANSNVTLTQTNTVGVPTATANRNIVMGVSGGGIEVADMATLTVDGTITGTTTLSKTGPGTLAISNISNNVPLKVMAGTVTGTNQNAGNAGFGTGPITLQGGATLNSTIGAATRWTMGNMLTVPAGEVGNIVTPGAFTLAGPVNGAGTLNITTTGMDLSNSFFGYTGTINFLGSGAVRAFMNGGNFDPPSLSAATVDLGGTVSLTAQTNSGGNTVTIGALTSSSPTAILGGGSAGSPTWQVGGINTNMVFQGTITGNAILSKVGTGTMTLTGENTNTGGLINAAGSTVQIGDPNINTGSSGSIGNGPIANAGSIVIARTSGVINAPGVVSGAGTITHSGGATTNLGGNNTYSGATTVTAGALNFTNTTGSGSGTSIVTVSGTGAVGGTGFVGSAVTINSGAALAPGSSGVGTITFNGPLTLAAGSKLNYEFSGFAQPNDLALVTTADALTINGGGVSLFQSGTTDPFSLNGVYNLIGYNGNIQGAGIGSLSVLNPNPAKSYLFGTAGGFVTLQVTPGGGASKFWNVDANGTWTTGGNWTTGIAPNGAGQAASFGGGGTAITAPRTVTLNANQTVGVVSFNSANSFTLSGASTLRLEAPGDAATINNTMGNHTVSVPLELTGDTLVNVLLGTDTLTISGAITGGAPNFAKVGIGTTVLSGNNNYFATNNIYAGTLKLTGGGKLGDASNALNMLGGTLDLTTAAAQTFGSLNISGGNISGGNFSSTGIFFTGGGNASISSAITGATSVQVTGSAAGVLALSGTNTFTGGVFLNSGTLSISADPNLGDLANSINLSGGTLRITGTTYHSFNAVRSVAGYNSAFDIADPANVFTISPGGSASGAALVKLGAGTLQVSGPTNFISSTTSTVQAGTLQISGGATSFGLFDQTGIAIAPGNGQTATMVVDAGAQVDTNRVIVGGNQANNAGGSATLNVSGTVNSQQWFTVGSAGAGTSTATLNGSAVVNVNTNAVTAGIQAEVANFGGANGVLNINGNSQLNLHNNANLVIGVQNNGAGNGTVNQNGGKVTFFSDAGFTIGSTTAGLRIGNGTGRNGTHTYNLNGGELIVPVIASAGNAGTRIFNFNGGTVIPTADSATFVSGVTAQIQAGGAIINTSGAAVPPTLPVPVNVTIAQPVVHDATAGAPVIDGGLTVTGNGGSVTLTGTNTFTGKALVTGTSTLNVNSSLALQNARLATFGASTGLKFNATAVPTRAFTIGGFDNDNNFDMLATDGNQIALSVGGTNVTSSYGGQLNGTAASSLTKVGMGTFSLTNAALTYAGPINANAGLLAINGTHNTGGSYTVNNGGQLGGTGTIGRPIAVAAGGFINPGASIGTLTTTGAVTMNGTGGLRIELSGNTTDRLNSNGTLTTSATSVLNFSLLSNLTTTQYVFGQYTGAAPTFAAPTFTAAAGTTGVVTPVGATVSFASNLMTLNVPAKTLRGNFNLDNTVDVNDIQAMLKALTNLTAYQNGGNSLGLTLTIPEMNQLGDFNNSGNATTLGVTNRDIQGMLNYFASIGAGSVASVPEPSTFVLLGLGAIMCVAGRRIRRTSRE